MICQPVGHEYINSHRALRQLAARLSEVGFPVLRFDYYGSGDSSGNTEDGRVAEWLEDIAAAIAELKRRTCLSEICLVGLRLGASLALLASLRRDDLRTLVLWDPVENGKNHVEELLLLEKELARFRSERRPQESGDYVDLLGFRFSSLLMADLGEINLLATPRVPVKNVLIIQGNEATDGDRLQRHLSRSLTGVERKRAQALPIWLPNSEGRLLVPAPLLQTVVSWICGACS